MKRIVPTVVFMFLAGCSTPNPVLMEAGDIYVVKEDNRALFSFGTPQSGEWYMNPSSVNTINRGFVNITGRDGHLKHLTTGYAISMGMDSEESIYMFGRIVETLKSGNYENYLRASLDRYTPKKLAEQKKSNPGGKLLTLNGMRCKNFWVDRHVGPNINNKRYGGQGLSLYDSYIVCPLVVDGEIYELGISIGSAVSDYQFKSAEEYNKNRKTEEPKFEINLDNYAPTLGDRFVEMFESLKVHGEVSQDYEDVAIKCHPTLGDDC